MRLSPAGSNPVCFKEKLSFRKERFYEIVTYGSTVKDRAEKIFMKWFKTYVELPFAREATWCWSVDTLYVHYWANQRFSQTNRVSFWMKTSRFSHSKLLMTLLTFLIRILLCYTLCRLFSSTDLCLSFKIISWFCKKKPWRKLNQFFSAKIWNLLLRLWGLFFIRLNWSKRLFTKTVIIHIYKLYPRISTKAFSE